MEAIKVKTYVGEDGMLKLEVPAGISNRELEVLLVLQPVEKDAQSKADWFTFIEETAGSLQDDPIERGDQGIMEIREPIE